MIKGIKTVWPGLLSAGLVFCGLSSALMAATSTATGVIPADRAGEPADTVELGAVKPIGAPDRAASPPVPRGNPLWSVPLSALTATQERPIFSVSRRPPPRGVIAPVAEVENAPAPPKAAEAGPMLALIGAVVGEGDSIAVFIDRASLKTVRLRPGEAHAGWVLSSVLRREVTLKKDDRTETIGLKAMEGQPATPGLPPPSAIGAAPVGSYAPFTPRSTPKNGESDGL
jgi:general secretion pathway protein N